MNRIKKGIVFFIIFALLTSGNAIRAGAEEKQYPLNVAVSVDGSEKGYIPALDDSYENNLYISLRGFAWMLNGTDKAFTPEIEKKKICITFGAEELLLTPAWDEEELAEVSSGTLGRNEILLNEEERKYYSIILKRDEEYDAFLTPICLAMMFDLDIKVTDGRIEIDTAKPFSVTAREMEESGYLQGVNALLVGDGTTGEIYYEYAADEPFPIASTTKLMTYLVFMDAVSRGECSLDDMVTISEHASKLSNGPDGVLPMTEGIQVPVTELLYGMLLPSSNECALAVAEHTAGSMEDFVERMNRKAAEMGWTNAVFLNSHGLPSYEDQLIPAKVHNRMTAEEMFRLASHIMETYPQITEYTSTKRQYLKYFGVEVKNTNAVLYNMDNVTGLKTGTTNRAGACLVTCVSAERDGEEHDLIVVLFGAEGDVNRGITSEAAARYAVNALRLGVPGRRDPVETEEEGIPADPEKVMEKIVMLSRGR